MKKKERKKEKNNDSKENFIPKISPQGAQIPLYYRCFILSPQVKPRDSISVSKFKMANGEYKRVLSHVPLKKLTKNPSFSSRNEPIPSLSQDPQRQLKRTEIFRRSEPKWGAFRWALSWLLPSFFSPFSRFLCNHPFPLLLCKH